MEALLPGLVHQGFAALSEEFAYTDLPLLAEISLRPEGNKLLLAADHITDEGNLGALMRTALFFGADGLIIPKDRAAGIGPGTMKRSSGAQMHLPVSKVVNMGRALDFLKDKGFWIIGAAEDGPVAVYDFDWNRKLVLVLGNEQSGLSPTVLKRCHEVVNYPFRRQHGLSERIRGRGGTSSQKFGDREERPAIPLRDNRGDKASPSSSSSFSVTSTMHVSVDWAPLLSVTVSMKVRDSVLSGAVNDGFYRSGIG